VFPSWKPASGTLEFEIAKAILQMGVVSVIGTVVSLLTFDYQQERKRLEYDEGLLKATLGKAMESYNTAKKARHLLLARARTVKSDSKEWLVSGPDYDSYMAMVIDAQLQLDNLARDVETNSRVFTRYGSEITKDLKSMEHYLSELIHDYDSMRPSFQEKVLLTALPHLSDFLLPRWGSKFENEVAVPFRKVQKYIRDELSQLFLASDR
jgi:hypothetical protein